ncbi:MAG: hypothetical protein ABIR48_03430 [Gammaproteobacteria bacterium]
MKTSLLMSLTVTSLTGLLFAASVPAAPPFETLDTDKNGLINMEESKGLKGLPVVFKYMDKNDSKMLEPEEYAYLRIGGEDNRRITPESVPAH